jgi:hypothetical protein
MLQVVRYGLRAGRGGQVRRVKTEVEGFVLANRRLVKCAIGNVGDRQRRGSWVECAAIEWCGLRYCGLSVVSAMALQSLSAILVSDMGSQCYEPSEFRIQKSGKSLICAISGVVGECNRLGVWRGRRARAQPQAV